MTSRCVHLPGPVLDSGGTEDDEFIDHAWADLCHTIAGRCRAIGMAQNRLMHFR